VTSQIHQIKRFRDDSAICFHGISVEVVMSPSNLEISSCGAIGALVLLWQALIAQPTGKRVVCVGTLFRPTTFDPTLGDGRSRFPEKAG
jgi:hypothetical protein